MPTVTKKRALPDAEIQTLADRALDAWESGVGVAATDSLGGLWSFQPVRDHFSRLELERTAGGDEPVTTRAVLTGSELGAHDAVRVLLASRILAMASP